MSTKLIIKQANTAELVTSALVDKIYQLASTEGALTNDSDLEGTITVNGAAYEDAVTFLRTKFPRLVINASAFYIRFGDANVLQTILNAGIGDGTGVSFADATTASLGTTFQNNTSIVSFEEFKFFTRANTTSGTVFDGCSNLKKIDITNCSVLPSFRDCGSLEYFNGEHSVQGVAVIPDGVIEISNRWSRCNGVTEIKLPDSLSRIGQSVFESMSSLTKVYFGSGITEILSQCFYNDTALTEVHIPDLNTWLDINFVISSGHQSNPLYFAHHLYVDGVEVTSVDFTGRTSVGTNVLSGASITSVVLTSALTSIGDRAFQDCSNLVISDLNLPNLLYLGSYAFQNTKIQVISNLGYITTIPAYCFSNCSLLTSYVIPNSVTVIGEYAFYKTKITTVNLPNVQNVGQRAFADCTMLTTATVKATGSRMFSGCSQLTNITILSGCTELAFECFSGCPFTSINIPDSVTSIANNVFLNCRQLSSITLPANVASIGDKAFWSNSALTSITVLATTPPTVQNENFIYNFRSDLVIYVPASSLAAYQSASGWSAHASRIQAIPTT